MGEIAEMMLSGVLDYETGEYIGDEVGYPRNRRIPKRDFTIKGIQRQFNCGFKAAEEIYIQRRKASEQKAKMYEVFMRYAIGEDWHEQFDRWNHTPKRDKQLKINKQETRQ